MDLVWCILLVGISGVVGCSNSGDPCPGIHDRLEVSSPQGFVLDASVRCAPSSNSTFYFAPRDCTAQQPCLGMNEYVVVMGYENPDPLDCTLTFLCPNNVTETVDASWRVGVSGCQHATPETAVVCSATSDAGTD